MPDDPLSRLKQLRDEIRRSLEVHWPADAAKPYLGKAERSERLKLLAEIEASIRSIEHR
jgi:hypothetical protein